MARSARLRDLAIGLASVCAVASMLVGCTQSPPARVIVVAEPETGTQWPTLVEYPGVRVLADERYATTDGVDLLVDVCLPAELATSTETVAGDDEALTAQPTFPAVISVHGGSWARGDKAEPHWRNVCEWLASEGFVALSINYRLAPTDPYPAAIGDVRSALDWIREPTQRERFRIDSARIGALGGSAGANLVALLGTSGTGAWNAGGRVASVVALSGPFDLTAHGRRLGGLTKAFEGVQLDYLDCNVLAECPAARDASPLYQIDPTDPPFFVAHSTTELIPLEQGTAFVDSLRAAGVSTVFDVVAGSRHSIGMLDDRLYASIAAFLHSTLDLAPAA